MRLRLREFRPRTGPHEHRVVQPWQPLRHTSLRSPEPIGLLFGDHDGLNRLAGLFSFAAYSRHTIVHVPLRDGVPPDEGTGELVDLVLAHRSYGLRPSKWPALRRTLGGPGTPLTVRTDEARTARDAAAWRERGPRSDRRDDLRHTTHARTLVLLGGREVFAEAAMSFAYAAGWGPRQKRVAEGRLAYMTGLPLADAPGGGHPVEVLVCFKPYPPYAHFRRPGERAGLRPPGERASRRRRPAVPPVRPPAPPTP
ncbi:hypothetical protein [Streptomyces brasiliensis]|uniref:Uncharacterized protein n=1 Tax=Streptomyces brasiliensis TaxID=1954 RepID=A0A917KLB0_9ACTN|nr:hypothetical protein [Streptomyces brasiliensis]GGJ19111.1 hypothetical protein GCM10010121_032570 [Streptomyces brasiliensis]